MAVYRESEKMKQKKYFIFSLLIFVSVFSNFYLLFMYFWLDSYTILYYVQNDVGMYFPYQNLTIIPHYLYSLFEIRPLGYNLLALLLYSLVSLLVYRLLLQLTKDKMISFAAALVFATGYIGQEALYMFLGDGVASISGLAMLLSSLIFLLKRKYFLTFLFYFLCLEFAAFRFGGSLIILIGTDLLISYREKGKRSLLVKRILIYSLIFFVEYFVHPTALLFGYPLSTRNVDSSLETMNRLSNLDKFQLSHILNSIGTFWNLFFPSSLLQDFYFWLKNNSSFSNMTIFWLMAIPSYLFSLLTFFVLRNKIDIRKYIFILIAFIFLYGSLLLNLDKDIFDKFFIFNGGVFLYCLILLLIFYSSLKREVMIGFVSAIGILSIFWLTKFDMLLVSHHRYLISASFTPPLLCLVFVGKNKKINIYLLIVVGFFVITHLYSGYISQEKLINNYARHALYFFNNIQRYVPDDKNKKIIYLTASDQNSSQILGGITRVGLLSSEAVFAVHYRQKMEDFVLPESEEEIIALLKENNEYHLEDVYALEYSDEFKIYDKTQEVREDIAENILSTE